MYIVDENWAGYYDETDPVKRRAILDEAVECDSDNGLRRKLFESRYPDDKSDMILRIFMDILSVQQANLFFLHWNIKSLKRTMDRAGFMEAMSQGETGRALLYFEIRNAMKRYLETCKGELYGSAYSGMIKISSKKQREKTRYDLYRMTFGFKKISDNTDVEGFRDYMNLICEAICDEYFMESGERLEEKGSV